MGESQGNQAQQNGESSRLVMSQPRAKSSRTQAPSHSHITHRLKETYRSILRMTEAEWHSHSDGNPSNPRGSKVGGKPHCAPSAFSVPVSRNQLSAGAGQVTEAYRPMSHPSLSDHDCTPSCGSHEAQCTLSCSCAPAHKCITRSAIKLELNAVRIRFIR